MPEPKRRSVLDAMDELEAKRKDKKRDKPARSEEDLDLGRIG